MKRRSTANQQAAGVSLFPFLAVLLCTMGAMIIVLVVIARHTRVKVAEEARRAAAAGGSGELAAQREDLEWRIDELKKSREATQKLLSDKQTELSHLEEHARRLKDQLEEAAAAREHFAELAAGDARENDNLKKRLSSIQKDADRTRAEIDKLRRNGGGGSGESYAIIPYHGPNETHRRPIYIECRKDVMILQPEGIVLTSEDFTVDLGPSNPLVSALRAVSDYHNRNELAGKGPAGMPYPLFIVRPDGIYSWFDARMAISSWGTDFGYELVGQDWKFDFPPADPRLTLAMREAIAEAKARQVMLARAAPRLSHSTGHAVFRASRQGGIVQVEGSSGGGGRRARGRPGIAGRRAAGGDGFGNGGPGLGGGGVGAGGFGGPRYNDTPPRLLATSQQNTGDGPVHSIDGNDNPYANALERTGAGNGIPGRSPGAPGGAGGSATGAPGAGAPGSGLAATGYGPNGSGNAPGYGLGQRSGPGYGQQPGSGFGQKPRTGPGGQPGSSLGQSGSRGNGTGPNGSSPSGSPSGKLLAMGGPLADGRYPAGSRYGNGSGGDGQQPGGGLSKGGASPDGTEGDGTQPGDGGPVGTQPGGQAMGTESGGTGSGGTVPGGIGQGGQVPGPAVPGGQLVGPARPGGNGNAPQGSAQAAPGIGVSGNPGAQQAGNPSGSQANPAAYQGRYASNPSSQSRAGGSSARAGQYGPTGSGTSDPNGTDDQAAGSNAAGGPDVAASPNGVAGAKAIGNGTTISESAGASTRYGGAGGQSDSGSLTSSGSGTAQAGGRGSMTRLNNTGGPNMNPIGQHLASSQNSSAGSGPSSSSSMGQQASAMGSGSSSMMQSMQGGMPSPNLNFAQQDQQASSSSKHHKQREKNWANPDAGTTNVPIQRPIRIVCDADHLTLLPEGRGRQGMRVIQLRPQTSESLDDLVSTVWDRIDSWGTAGRNMYWRPTLVMEVEPGGERRYAELQAMLANSGFDVHARPRTRALVGPRRPGPIR
jgi:hypothetical protein